MISFPHVPPPPDPLASLLPLHPAARGVVVTGASTAPSPSPSPSATDAATAATTAAAAATANSTIAKSTATGISTSNPSSATRATAAAGGGGGGSHGKQWLRANAADLSGRFVALHAWVPWLGFVTRARQANLRRSLQFEAPMY